MRFPLLICLAFGSLSGVCAALSHRCLALFSSHRSLGNLAVNLALTEAVSAYLPGTSNCHLRNRRLASVGAAVLHFDQGR